MAIRALLDSELLLEKSDVCIALVVMLIIASLAATKRWMRQSSAVQTYPLTSTLLQRKRQFRVNGAKVIEHGFAEARFFGSRQS